MTTQAQMDLLIDLVKLLKKHGSKTFRSLASVLHDPSLLETMCQILEAVPKVSLTSVPKRATNSRRPPLPSPFDVLEETSPEKAQLLRQVQEQLMVPNAIPITELREYARRSGLPQLEHGTRRRVVQEFVSSLVDLDVDAIKRHIQQLAIPPEDRTRDLGGWSRIILDPELRSKQGS